MIYDTRLMLGKFVILTSAFFGQTYPNGIDDAVVLMSACSSGVSRDLLNVLNGKNTVVLGWNNTVTIGTAAAAGLLIAKAMVEVDQPFKSDSGVTAGQSIERIKAFLRDVQDNKPSRMECLAPSTPEMEARCLLARGTTTTLTVLNDVPADATTGATLVMVGDNDVRAREVAYLVGPGDQELADGGFLPVIGAAGDGKGDDIAVKIRVDGLALEDDPQAVRLAIAIDDRRIPVNEPLAKHLGAGVWEPAYRLPLGRDHTVGEVVDVEVIADLPGGKESRWLYEDIRLASRFWTMQLSGVRSGSYGASRASALMGPDGVRAISLSSDSGDPLNLVSIEFGSGNSKQTISGPGSFPALVGIGVNMDKLGTPAADGFCTRSGGEYPPPPQVTITSVDSEYVVGSVTGQLYRCDPGHKPEERATVQIDFVAAVCGPGVPGRRC